MKHLVFYDGECGLCDKVVQLLLVADKNGIFAFAPLQGETAKQRLNELPEKYKGVDSLILIENYKDSYSQYFVLGKGALRIAWLLGGWWSSIGWLSFLPGFLFNWAYRIIAYNRHYFFDHDSCRIPSSADRSRFLP